MLLGFLERGPVYRPDRSWIFSRCPHAQAAHQDGSQRRAVTARFDSRQVGRLPIRARNSSRVAVDSRNVPSTDEVIITEFCFSTPRIIMHKWRASIITPTPLASIDSMTSLDIC